MFVYMDKILKFSQSKTVVMNFGPDSLEKVLIKSVTSESV